MNRRLTVTLTALMLAAGMAGMSGAGASSGGNLTGDWSSPLPSELGGTSLALTQSGSTITWQGGPNDRSWVQKFTGELSGDTISGSFEQDVPGRTPARYHGTITARVIDSCHFKTILVRQPGVPDTGGAMFTKSPCAKTAISGSWQVRAHQTLKGTAVGMVGAGQFVGDANGQIVSRTSGSGNLIVSFHDKKRPGRNDVWHMKITGPGRYRASDAENSTGTIRLVAEVMSTANRSRVHLCKADPYGILTAQPDTPNGPMVELKGVCGITLALRAKVARGLEDS